MMDHKRERIRGEGGTTTRALTLHARNARPAQDLIPFLNMHKRQGYTIVGIEQTSSSQPLHKHAKFPDKTLVLLGDERRGIPVELLNFVDFCVEIPQFGLARSLNVHVCGAVVMWEYLKDQASMGGGADSS